MVIDLFERSYDIHRLFYDLREKEMYIYTDNGFHFPSVYVISPRIHITKEGEKMYIIIAEVITGTSVINNYEYLAPRIIKYISSIKQYKEWEKACVVSEELIEGVHSYLVDSKKNLWQRLKINVYPEYDKTILTTIKYEYEKDEK